MALPEPDPFFVQVSKEAGRPVHSLIGDLYPNEIENIMRKWFGQLSLTREISEEIIQNNWRSVDYGHFPDTRGDPL